MFLLAKNPVHVKRTEAKQLVNLSLNEAAELKHPICIEKVKTRLNWPNENQFTAYIADC